MSSNVFDLSRLREMSWKAHQDNRLSSDHVTDQGILLTSFFVPKFDFTVFIVLKYH